MKRVYGYTRVSTLKQGNGVSLKEQEEAILRYADKHGLKIIQWFEELETAAKQGRPLFTNMMKCLKAGKADGVIIHKIDRSARNLKDWAALGDLIDQGVEVHFAHESLDMNARGGRLAADIQAVIASDYIRNLREEALKGLYGRLKQGIYPFGAPIGYLNNGGGQVKTIDPVKGPLVHKAFRLYASEKYSLNELTAVIKRIGLRNLRGNHLTKTTLAKILKNPFYTGVLKIKGRTFVGRHEPLVSSKLFQRVQDILAGKTNTKHSKHNYLFRRMIKCVECNFSLVGSKQKGRVYYRCHTKECPTKTLREDHIEKALVALLERLNLSQVQNTILNELLDETQKNWWSTENRYEESLKMLEQKASIKLERLTDAYIENSIDKPTFDNRKEKLLVEISGIQQKKGQFENQKDLVFKKVSDYLELAKSLKKTYLMALRTEKRKIVKCVTSNLQLRGKELIISIRSPFQEIANANNLMLCGPNRNTPRTFEVKVVMPSYNRQGVDWPALSMPKNCDSGNLSPDKEREKMKLLFDLIMSYFEEETQLVENGSLKEEDQLLSPYVQEDDPDTQHHPRPVPPNFKRKRA